MNDEDIIYTIGDYNGLTKKGRLYEGNNPVNVEKLKSELEEISDKYTTMMV